MPEFKRVRLDASGAKVTVAHVRDGMTVIDEPALDRNRRPREPEYPAEPVEVDPYKGWKVDRLKSEVDARNDAAGDHEPQIVVDEPGNKPELLSALRADDARRAQS